RPDPARRRPFVPPRGPFLTWALSGMPAQGPWRLEEPASMTAPDWPTGLPHNFGGLDEAFGALARARALVLPVPYDFTTTYQGGTRSGPRAILAASQNMELWDEEVGAVYRSGIHTLPELEPAAEG